MPVEESSELFLSRRCHNRRKSESGACLCRMVCRLLQGRQKKGGADDSAGKCGAGLSFRCPTSGQLEVLEDYQPAGYCLMADAFADKTKEQVRAMTDPFRQQATFRLLCAATRREVRSCVSAVILPWPIKNFNRRSRFLPGAAWRQSVQTPWKKSNCCGSWG